MNPCARHLAAALAASSILTAAAEARADSKQECAAAYDGVQSCRREGKLIEARRQAVTCSAPTCSTYVTEDCVKWLAEIEASLPTVVFTAHDASGADTAAVRVTVDGKVLAERLDGKAVPLDPGEHVVRFELEGAAAIDQKVLIREGERNRTLSASFQKAPDEGGSAPKPSTGPPPTPAPPPAPAVVSPVQEQPAGPRSTQRTAGAVLLGVGGAGIVLGAVAGTLVIVQHGTLAAACGQGSCPLTELGAVNAYHAKGWIANIGFIGGAAVAAAGAVVLLTAPKKAPAVGAVTPYVGLGTVGAVGRFW